jgi:UDPglucose--hexose-1-phosphate uridylyltransferase
MIEQFVTFAIKNGGWMELDRQYLTNRVFELIGKNPPVEMDATAKKTAERLAKTASKDEAVQYMIFVQLLDILTPPPSVVNAYFAEVYHQSPESATQYYHELLGNIGFFETSGVKQAEDFLDFEAEGTLNSMNNRFIRMNLTGQSWGFQLLPIAKEERGIVFPEIAAHFSTIKISLMKLFEILEVFPHYQVSMGAGFFHTEKKQLLPDFGVLHEISSSELVEGVLFPEEFILELSSYNKEELVRLVKMAEFRDYKTVVGYRTENKFTLRLLLRSEEAMLETVRRVK